MSGYPYQPPSGYGYGGPSPPPPYGGSSGHSQSQSHGSTPPQPQSYGSSGYPQSQSYGSAPPPPQPYGSSAPYGSSPSHQQQQSHGAPSAPYAAPYGAPPPKEKPHPASSGHGGGSGYPPSASYGSPFASLVPSAFPPGTDPSIVACFQMADQDGSGFIDDKELQRALSSYNQSFSLRTVHLLMYLFTNTNTRKIGGVVGGVTTVIPPRGRWMRWTKRVHSSVLQSSELEGYFREFDRDRSGKIDANELKEALLSLGFSVSPVVLQLLVSKFDKTGGRNNAIEYDNFIECCLTVKGLTEKFKEKDMAFTGSATFSYETFMLTVLPFLVA